MQQRATRIMYTRRPTPHKCEGGFSRKIQIFFWIKLRNLVLGVLKVNSPKFHKLIRRFVFRWLQVILKLSVTFVIVGRYVIHLYKKLSAGAYVYIYYHNCTVWALTTSKKIFLFSFIMYLTFVISGLERDIHISLKMCRVHEVNMF